MNLILGIIISVIIGGVGGFFGGWFAKPPEYQITEIKQETKITVDASSESRIESKGYQIQSTENYIFPDYKAQLVNTNTNNLLTQVTNMVKMALTNTNYIKTTTNITRGRTNL